ncbi:MAG: sterol desaturase family protein [Campylobacterota bacterium]
MSLLETLKDPYYFFTLLIVINLFFYLFSLGFSHVWAHFKKDTLPKKTFSDFMNTLLVLFTNIVIAIPGFMLFSNDMIRFNVESNVVIDTLILLLVIDLAMYISHKLAHTVFPFSHFHLKHHTHHHFNEFSLYVMNPIESIGLGLIITLLLYLHSFNLYAVGIFLVINWAWGVVAHLNSEKKRASDFLCNSVFHAIHHQNGERNFGFYTVIWDKLFASYQKNL